MINKSVLRHFNKWLYRNTSKSIIKVLKAQNINVYGYYVKLYGNNKTLDHAKKHHIKKIISGYIDLYA